MARTTASDRAPLELAATEVTRKVERRMLEFFRRNDVFQRGEEVVVAVSGGPDSTALLVLLSRLSPKLNLQLTAAHFNHLLRDAGDAAADLDFVRALASTLSVRLVHGEGDVRFTMHSEQRSIEDAARHLRYAFLAEQANQLSASAVATGHTLDDQAETVLLHLIRGAGLDGLAGMRPRSPWPFGGGPDVARPLLSLRRQDIEQYCAEVGLSPRKDPTNELPIAARNRLRKQLIPPLRRFNPNIDEAIGRFASSAARDADYLQDLARHHFARIASLRPESVSFARADLLVANPAIASRLLRLAYAHLTGSPAGLEETHIDSLLDALSRPPGGLSLPGGVTASTDSTSLVLRLGPPQPAARLPETRLAVPGRIEVAGDAFQMEIVAVPADAQSPGPYEAFLDAERAGTDLIVRSRHPGDRLRPLGLGGEKKLQDILVDAKVPAAERDSIPLVCADDQIAWVVGHCIDERFALRDDSKRALHIVFLRGADR